MSLATLTIPDILRWDPAAIYDVFRIVQTREQTFADFGTHLQRVQNTLADWGGDAGEAFPELTANGQNLNVLADRAGLSGDGLTEFRRITEGVRGGSWTEVNAHEDRREAAYQRAMAVLHAS